MNRLIFAKIDVKKIDKTKLFKGERGTYLDIAIWLNDTPDKYGNDISIQQKTSQGESKIYLGEGKFFVKRDEAPATTQTATLPENKELDDLPF